jgi:hypothetical protein
MQRPLPPIGVVHAMETSQPLKSMNALPVSRVRGAVPPVPFPSIVSALAENSRGH